MTRSKVEDDFAPLPEASAIMLDPVLSLGASVLRQAIRDLADPDPILALDAYEWLTNGEGGLWLELLSLVDDADLVPDLLLEWIRSTGAIYDKRQRRTILNSDTDPAPRARAGASKLVQVGVSPTPALPGAGSSRGRKECALA